MKIWEVKRYPEHVDSSGERCSWTDHIDLGLTFGGKPHTRCINNCRGSEVVVTNARNLGEWANGGEGHWRGGFLGILLLIVFMLVAPNLPEILRWLADQFEQMEGVN